MEIRPFRAWRYSTKTSRDIGPELAPPYDVLTGADKQDLLQRSGHNIVAVDLPHVPPVDLGPDEVYEQAAATVKLWQDQGVLVQEGAPAIYAYNQTYTWAGKTYTRHGMICAIRATEMGKDIIPHEHTFAGPKADRLRLTEKTGLQMSPVFGFYNDPDQAVSKILTGVTACEPDAFGKLNDVTEELWPITDETVICQIASLLAETPAFIADGHHRCNTAMNYSRALREAGEIDENHPANFVMFVLVARNDPGLLVLPTHRLISNLKDDFCLDDLVGSAEGFSWHDCPLTGQDLSDPDALLEPFGPGSMIFVGPGAREARIGTLTDPSQIVQAAGQECDTWRGLDVSILQELIIKRALADHRAGDLDVQYTPRGQALLDACGAGEAQLGICLRSTELGDVEKIGLAGAAMPHKSTYFYPKLATGMALKPMA